MHECGSGLSRNRDNQFWTLETRDWNLEVHNSELVRLMLCVSVQFLASSFQHLELRWHRGENRPYYMSNSLCDEGGFLFGTATRNPNINGRLP